MRDQDTIEQEIADTREDLAHNLSDLTDAVRDKVDVKARARRAVDQARGKVVSGYQQTIRTARERPALTISVLGLIVAIAGVTGYVLYMRRRSTC